MTENEFDNLYWKQYLMIEKEFKSTTKYVTIDSQNFKTYSDVYTKILLQIGSEIDVVAKILCKEINVNSTASDINKYGLEICMRFTDFTKIIVACGDIDLKPWAGWTVGYAGIPGSPIWWQIYNGVKHNRNKFETYGAGSDVFTEINYKLANQENVLNALAALFQLEQYLYSIILHNVRVETPIPGSRLFSLKGNGWENKQFGKDTIVFIDKEDGCLYRIEADTFYTDI